MPTRLHPSPWRPCRVGRWRATTWRPWCRCRLGLDLPGIQRDRSELVKPARREPQNVLGIATCTNHKFIRINIVEKLGIRDEAGFVDELAAKQLVEDTLQRPEVP